MSVPTSQGDARKKNKHGADLKLSVAEGKHDVAIADPGADRSAANVERARRNRWPRVGFDSTTASKRTT